MNLLRVSTALVLVLVLCSVTTEGALITLLLLKMIAMKGALFFGMPLAIGSFMMGQGMGFFGGSMYGAYTMMDASHKYHKVKVHPTVVHSSPSIPVGTSGLGWGESSVPISTVSDGWSDVTHPADWSTIPVTKGHNLFGHHGPHKRFPGWGKPSALRNFLSIPSRIVNHYRRKRPIKFHPVHAPHVGGSHGVGFEVPNSPPVWTADWHPVKEVVDVKLESPEHSDKYVADGYEADSAPHIVTVSPVSPAPAPVTESHNDIVGGGHGSHDYVQKVSSPNSIDIDNAGYGESVQYSSQNSQQSLLTHSPLQHHQLTPLYEPYLVNHRSSQELASSASQKWYQKVRPPNSAIEKFLEERLANELKSGETSPGQKEEASELMSMLRQIYVQELVDSVHGKEEGPTTELPHFKPFPMEEKSTKTTATTTTTVAPTMTTTGKPKPQKRRRIGGRNIHSYVSSSTSTSQGDDPHYKEWQEKVSRRVTRDTSTKTKKLRIKKKIIKIDVKAFKNDVKKFFHLISFMDQDKCLQKLVCDVHRRAAGGDKMNSYEQNIITTFRRMDKVQMDYNEDDSTTVYRKAAKIGELNQSCDESFPTCKYSPGEIISMGNMVANSDDVKKN